MTPSTDNAATLSNLRNETPRYMRCQTCQVVIRTTGEDSLADFHGKRCDSVLVETPGCQATIFHGPGHQSSARCEIASTDHEVHMAHLHDERVRWRGIETCTGFFDESPLEDE